MAFECSRDYVVGDSVVRDHGSLRHVQVGKMLVFLRRSRKFVYYAIAVCIANLPITSSASEPDLSARYAQVLVRVGTAAGATLAASGNRIRNGNKVVRLQPQIENDERADTKSLIGLRVDVFVDEVLQPLTYGSLGIGNNREDAISTAVSEWAMVVLAEHLALPKKGA
jgi:hypothetical protein